MSNPNQPTTLQDVITFIEGVRQNPGIVKIINHSVPLTKNGKNYVAQCIFCKSTEPDFHVSPDSARFKCFRCGEAGDIFTWLMKAQGLDASNAIAMVANWASKPDTAAPVAANKDGHNESFKPLSLDSIPRFIFGKPFDEKQPNPGIQFLTSQFEQAHATHTVIQCNEEPEDDGPMNAVLGHHYRVGYAVYCPQVLSDRNPEGTYTLYVYRYTIEPGHAHELVPTEYSRCRRVWVAGEMPSEAAALGMWEHYIDANIRGKLNTIPCGLKVDFIQTERYDFAFLMELDPLGCFTGKIWRHGAGWHPDAWRLSAEFTTWSELELYGYWESVCDMLLTPMDDDWDDETPKAAV